MKTSAVWLTIWRSILGAGLLAWELGVDQLRHWPPIFVFAFWLLGGPIEEIVRFVTSGRIQINVRDSGKDEPPGKDEPS